MKKVYKITEAEAIQLRGREFDTDSYFNPIQDRDGYWVISKEEVLNLKKTEFNFLLNKEEITYKNKDKDTNPFKSKGGG